MRTLWVEYIWEDITDYCKCQMPGTASTASRGPAKPLPPYGADANFLTLSFLFLLLEREMISFFASKRAFQQFLFNSQTSVTSNKMITIAPRHRGCWHDHPPVQKLQKHNFAQTGPSSTQPGPGRPLCRQLSRPAAGTGQGASSRVAICLWSSLSTSQGGSPICFLFFDPSQSPVSHIME